MLSTNDLQYISLKFLDAQMGNYIAIMHIIKYVLTSPCLIIRFVISFFQLDYFMTCISLNLICTNVYSVINK